MVYCKLIHKGGKVKLEENSAYPTKIFFWKCQQPWCHLCFPGTGKYLSKKQEKGFSHENSFIKSISMQLRAGMQPANVLLLISVIPQLLAGSASSASSQHPSKQART